MVSTSCLSSDYRGLKKRITAIRRLSDEPPTEDSSPPARPTTPVLIAHDVHTRSNHDDGDDHPILSPKDSLTEVEEGYEQDEESEHHECMDSVGEVRF